MNKSFPKKVKSLTVAEPSSHERGIERTRPMAFVRWEDGESAILSEGELRRLIDRYRAVGQEIPTDLQNGLRQFESYPLSQREQPTKPK